MASPKLMQEIGELAAAFTDYCKINNVECAIIATDGDYVISTLTDDINVIATAIASDGGQECGLQEIAKIATYKMMIESQKTSN